MTPQELKNSILQLAIQGKLVEQRPDEGTGEELFRKIQAEKQVLIKAGKIKKEKPLPEISDDEKPFDIPESWAWVKFGDIVYHNMGKTPSRTESQWWGKDIPWVSISDMIENGRVDSTKERIAESALSEVFGNKISKAGTLLMSFKLTVGRVSILDIDAVHNEAIISIYPCYDIDNATQMYLFKILPFISQYGESKNAIKGKTLNSTSINNMLVPLPPLAEQKRIVAKIEELLPYIDRYAEAWDRLEALNKRFPEDIKKSLLQMAIQGKLVEQRPEEGTGEELYRKIQAEKQTLIKAGKIKKEKPLPEIAEDEIPFDIPESWIWVKVGNMAVVQSSKRVFEKDYVPEGIPFFRSKEIGDLYRNEPIKTELFITEEHYKALAEGYGVPQKGDILITSVGTIGNTWICDERKFYYKDGNITQICGSQFFDSKYVEYFLHSPWFEKQALSTVAGTAYSALTIVKSKNLIIPLPPLAEQKRIVAKLEEILPLCERLK